MQWGQSVPERGCDGYQKWGGCTGAIKCREAVRCGEAVRCEEVGTCLSVTEWHEGKHPQPLPAFVDCNACPLPTFFDCNPSELTINACQSGMLCTNPEPMPFGSACRLVCLLPPLLHLTFIFLALPAGSFTASPPFFLLNATLPGSLFATAVPHCSACRIICCQLTLLGAGAAGVGGGAAGHASVA